jgi:hypothetical protein
MKRTPKYLLYVLDGEPVGRKRLDLFLGAVATGPGPVFASAVCRAAIASNVPPGATSRPTLTIAWRRGGSGNACTVMTSTTRSKASPPGRRRKQVGRHVVHR